MRRPLPLLLLLSVPLSLLALISGCQRGEVAAGSVTAGSVTVVPVATLAATSTPPAVDEPVLTSTGTPTGTLSPQDGGAPDGADSDAAVQAVSALLQRKVPTLPSRPLSGPTPNVGRRTNPRQDQGGTLPSPTPTPEADDNDADSTDDNAAPRRVGADDGPAGVVNASVVNVRGGPGTVYAIAGKVRSGQEVVITGRNEDGSWLQICCPVEGEEQTWISADFLNLESAREDSLDGVPVAQAPPAPEPVANAAAPAPGSGAGVGLPAPGGFPAPGANNPLTGQPLPGGRSGQRPIIVCINNDFAARPQLGTSQADVMYEYLMEGYGITRFSGVYYGQPASQIGPVRSARLINYYMGALYDAGLVCSGASDKVRYALKHQAPFPYLDIDLDDPSNARYSDSVGSDYRTRLRTSTDRLRKWLADWGVEKPASIRGFTFGGVPDGGAPATSVNIPYPNGQAAYRYDGGSGRYLRSMSGGSHVDGNTGAQLALDNVIVQFVPHQATDIVEDSLGSTSIRLDLFGSGRAIVFRDGQAFDGTWRSESRGDTPRFYDASGAEVPLKPGRSFISVVPVDYGVTFQ